MKLRACFILTIKFGLIPTTVKQPCMLIDTHSLYLQDTLILSSLKNVDWEDIAQDTSFIYIGDFGNNAKGNRQNLTILRVHKSSIHQSLIIVGSINFSYSKQVDFQNQPANTSNFDCEAFIVMHDSLYLFTKEWSTYYTSIYVLPVKPGTYKAYYRGRFAVPGLITGASFYATTNTIVFCGYSKTLQPFLYLLYDFPTHDLFKGNKRQIALNLPFYQVEGICSSDGYYYYFSNEKFSQSMIRVPQQIHQLNLRPFLPSIKQEMNHE